MSAEVDQDLVEMMSAVFESNREAAGPREGVAVWDGPLWRQLGELGLSRLTGSEDGGGSGAGWLEAAELLRAAAWHGVAVPLAEHDLLAGWLLETAGLPVDDARRTVAVLDGNGRATGVGWAAQAQRVVAVWRAGDTWVVADADPAVCSIVPGVNGADEPRDTVSADISALDGTPVSDGTVAQLRLRGALARGVQVSAALDRILDLALTHAGERVQFGRPLAKFQAVQNLVSDIAAEAALARAATDAAVAEAVRTDWGAPDLEFLVAVARSCAGHAASVAARNGHQVLGAIGTTREHRLHEFTRPALAWRSEFGSVYHWDAVVSEAAVAAGREGLWPLIAGG